MTTTIQPTDVMVTCNGMNFHYLDWGNEGRRSCYSSTV